MRAIWWFAHSLTVFLVLFQGVPISAAEIKPAPAGPVITIHAPRPEQFELALDEIELDWSRQPRAKELAPAQHAAPTARARLVEKQAVRAIASVSGVADSADLLIEAKALKTANPGAEAHLVLYESKRPRNSATRRLLTREVGLLLEEGTDLKGLLSGLPVVAIRPVPGVATGYVVEAADPIAALDLAETLRLRPGVRSAYPLLKRQYFKR